MANKDQKKKPKKKKVLSAAQKAKLRAEKVRTQAETDYGTGERLDPPQFWEMSPDSQRAVSRGYTEAMSRWRTKGAADISTGKKVKLTKPQAAALSDKRMGISAGATNVAKAWDELLTEEVSSEGAISHTPGWYFGSNRRQTEAATHFSISPEQFINASSSMSPQNSPDAEFRAARAMADAVANNRTVNLPGRTAPVPLTSLTPDEVEKYTSAEYTISSSKSKPAEVTTVPGDEFDLAGFRSGGTNKKEGWKGMSDPTYNPVAKMKTAKVPWYSAITQKSLPDTGMHAEYIQRYYDQVAARKVNEKRKRDAERGEEVLRGVPERVDLYGFKRGSDDPDDPAYTHPIFGVKGLAVPDTWMNAIISGQPIEDTEAGASSPAKAAASLSRATSASTAGSSFMSPGEAKAAGGKEFTPEAAWGVASLEAIQQGALRAREPGSETNIPPVMVQEMTWKRERNKVAKSLETVARKLDKHPQYTRLAALRGGQLTEESAMRDRPGTGKVQETPGSFFRGLPEDEDLYGSVRIIPRQSPEN